MRRPAIDLDGTVTHVEARIDELNRIIKSASEELAFLKHARNVFASPLASTIPFSLEAPGGDAQPVMKGSSYGELKKSVFMFLSETASLSPSGLVDRMQEAGFVFRSKTPAVSVNEALQTLKAEGKARIEGRAATGANLWVKEIGAIAPSDEDVQEETPADAGVDEIEVGSHVGTFQGT